jgi:hypothetical protein
MWAANFGMLAAYALGAVLIDSPHGWRWLLGIGGLLVVPLLLLRKRLPESSTWGRSRLASITSILDVLSRQPQRGRLCVSAINWFSYQISDQGLTIFLPLVLPGVLHISLAPAAWSSVAVKAITVPAALATVGLIDRLGRRPLQIWGFLGRGLPLIILGWWLLQGTQGSPAAVIGLLALAYAAGAAGPDKTTVITSAENFPPESRATGQALAGAAGRFGGIVGIVGYGILASLWGPGAGLLLFGAAALLGFIVSALALPESRAGFAVSSSD